MRIRNFLCQSLVSLASVGIVLPQMVYAVDRVGRPPAPIQDVTLDNQGALHGQLLDADGKPLIAGRVSLRQNGHVTYEAETDGAGRFAVVGMRAGVYEITTARTSGVYRVWAAGSAPPSARGTVLLVDKGDVVRGQGGSWTQLFLITGLIVAAGVIGGVIGYNVHEDDEAS